MAAWIYFIIIIGIILSLQIAPTNSKILDQQKKPFH